MKIYLYLFAALATLSGCSTSDNSTTPAPQATAVSFAIEPTTRAAFGDDMFKNSFAEDDLIGIFVIDANGNISDTAVPVCYKVGADGTSLEPYYNDDHAIIEGEGSSYYAVYPYKELTTWASYEEQMLTAVGEEDLLKAYAIPVDNSTSSYTLSFSHVYCYLEFQISAASFNDTDITLSLTLDSEKVVDNETISPGAATTVTYALFTLPFEPGQVTLDISATVSQSAKDYTLTLSTPLGDSPTQGGKKYIIPITLQ